MSTDEKAIIDYLKLFRDAFVSSREISRRAGGKRRYEEDNSWALRSLRAMVTKGWLETDATGHFRLPHEEDKKKKKTARRHLSPLMRKILADSGRSFEGFTLDEGGV